AEQHATDLLAPATDDILGEVALTNPDPAAKHRALLASARTDGFAAAYRPTLLTDSLHAWMATETWEDSRDYLASHLDLLTSETAEVLATFAPSAVTHTHFALLHLASHADIDTAYRCLTDRNALTEQLRHATCPTLPRSVAVL